MAGILKIGGSTIPGAYIMPPIIGAFRTKYPSVSVQLVIDDTAKVAEAVMNGDLSIGVVGARVIEPHLDAHPFLSDELVVAVPPGHAWEKRKSVAVDELRGEPFILREKGSARGVSWRSG
jgi:DNA-binding transcriptional LysR family regulator